MLRQVLVIMVHPGLSRSFVTKRIWKQLEGLPGIECHDLYRLYPDFYIDVAKEQEKLRSANLIIFLHPIYWYGAPSLLKEWQCRVLLEDFAYGEKNELEGKDFWQVVSTGGPLEKYTEDGRFGCEMPILLKPFEAMSRKCQMNWHTPKVLFRAHGVNDDAVDEHARNVLRIILDYQSEGNSAFM